MGKIVGIVAEYNPFHNGHAYLAKMAREISGCDYVIAAMSGDFVQRGYIAFADKYDRARAALSNGLDMVLMLPVSVSTASAEYFAKGAVKTLIEAGVDTLAFGIELADFNSSYLEKTENGIDSKCFAKMSAELRNKFYSLAHFLVNADKDRNSDFNKAIRRGLAKGLSFPVARTFAIKEAGEFSDEVIELSKQPNNQLAIEYMKAAISLGREDMEFLLVPRCDSGYHGTEVIGKFASASLVRELVGAGNDDYKRFIPDYDFEHGIITEENAKLDAFMHMALLKLEKKAGTLNVRIDNDQTDSEESELTVAGNVGKDDILDVNEDIFNRILALLPEYKGFHQFATILKNKSITYTRACRVLIHILLEIEKSEVNYIRVLGVKKSALTLLGTINKNSKLPVVSRMTDGDNLTGAAREQFKEDLFAADMAAGIRGCERDYKRIFLTV